MKCNQARPGFVVSSCPHPAKITITPRAPPPPLWIVIKAKLQQVHKSSKRNVQQYWLFGLVGRVFANSPEDLGSIPGRIMPKIFKMVLDTSLLNTQQYKVCIKGKVEQSRERSSAYLSVVAVEKGACWSPSITVANFTYYK